MDIEHSEIIILRQSIFKESGLIISGLSPDFGKLDLVAYRAMKSGGQTAPAFDLFRRVQISFKPPAEGNDTALGSVVESELIEEYTNLPRKPENLDFVTKISKFLLKNSIYGTPTPLVFDAFCNILAGLSAGVWGTTQCSILIKITYLYENGLLPEPDNLSPEGAAKVMELYERLIESAVDRSPMPKLSEAYYNQLNSYLNSLIIANNLPWA